MARGLTGTSLGGKIRLTDAAAKRRKKAMARQEQNWARRSSPVTVRQMTPGEQAALRRVERKAAWRSTRSR